VSGVQRLASASGVRLALPLWSGRRRPLLRRRVALALALLGVAVPAALVTSRTLRQRRAASAAVAAAPKEAPRPTPIAAEPVRPPAPSRATPHTPAPPERVVASPHASALFAKHSWYVAPPPRPAPPPPPPPEPTAPALPFTFLGSYAPQGDAPVFFLSKSDRVIDAHVGDRIDGVYELESAAGGRLVFVYLPLNIRQNLAARVSP
jgi:hypothetical protein